MIFPVHRIIEQLKKQADITQDEARLVARTMSIQAQGVVAPEDFFYLAHRLACGGQGLGATIGQNNQFILRNRQADPSEVVVQRVTFNNRMTMTLLFPADVTGFTDALTARLVDSSFYNLATAGPLTVAPAGQVMTRVAAGFLGITLGFVGVVGQTKDLDLNFVLREGFALGFTGAANEVDDVFFQWRELDLRIR